MPFLYITEQGSYLRKLGQSAVLFKKNEKIMEMPIKDIEAVVIFGNVQVSSQLLLAILKSGADIALMTKNGHFRGRVVSSKSKNSEIRMKHFENSIDPHYCLEMSRNIVAAKLKNGIQLLKKYHYSSRSDFHFDKFDKLNEFIARSESAREIEELRGYEGNASKIYFEGLKRCLKNPMGFNGRKYFPSTDPVNALLSFGYSFVSRELQGLIEAAGLDPYIGFFHKIKYGRASLSLDMVETFRHILVDGLVAMITNRGYLSESDFYKDEETGGIYLKRDSVKIFIKHYEEYCNRENVTYRENEGYSYRKIFRKEVENLRSAIDRREPYYPFVYGKD